MATKIESRLSALELVAEKVAATPPSITVVYMGRDGREVRRVEVPIPATSAMPERLPSAWIERSYGRPEAK